MKKNKQICSISGCISDEAYAVIDDKKLYRITFSKSLAEYIVQTIGFGEVKKIQLILGKELKPGEKSSSGLFAICKAKSKWPLRVTLFKDLAEMWKNYSTCIYECYIKTL